MAWIQWAHMLRKASNGPGSLVGWDAAAGSTIGGVVILGIVAEGVMAGNLAVSAPGEEFVHAIDCDMGDDCWCSSTTRRSRASKRRARRQRARERAAYQAMTRERV